MFSLAALICWIGGLILLSASPAAGACLAAAGFVFAGKAVYRKDDMATMFGILFLFVIVGNIWAFVDWLFF